MIEAAVKYNIWERLGIVEKVTQNLLNEIIFLNAVLIESFITLYNEGESKLTVKCRCPLTTFFDKDLKMGCIYVTHEKDWKTLSFSGMTLCSWYL